MNAGVGHRVFPMGQKEILRCQALKPASRQGIILNVFDACFYLALVSGHRWLGGQDHRAVVLAKGNHLGIEFGIKPIGFADRSPKIVDHQGGRHAAKMPKGIFQPANEVLCGLPVEGFRIAFARAAQHHAQHMRTPAAALFNDPSSLAKVHLRLLPRFSFHAAEG
jgi:hypothetical protein